MLSALLLVLAGQSAAGTASPLPVVEPDPRTMSRAAIRDHNANLAKDDPFYIKCERQAETGSLVSRKAVCRTNRQWAALDKATSDQIRGLGNDMTTNSASNSGN